MSERIFCSGTDENGYLCPSRGIYIWDGKPYCGTCKDALDDEAKNATARLANTAKSKQATR